MCESLHGGLAEGRKHNNKCDGSALEAAKDDRVEGPVSMSLKARWTRCGGPEGESGFERLAAETIGQPQVLRSWTCVALLGADGGDGYVGGEKGDGVTH